MIRLSHLAVAAVVAVSALGFSERSAHALGPVDLEVGAKVGVATNPDSNFANPYGIGLGARAGVGILGFYGGLSAIHYFGSSDELLGAKYDVSSTLLGVEAGYTISALPVVQIRPQLGLGNASFSSSAGGSSSSKSYLYLEPGVTALVPLGLVYVGADLNLLAVPGVDYGNDSKTYTSLSFHAQVGIRL